jgi:hypothetical protein
LAETRAGAVTAANGSTLLQAIGIINPKALVTPWLGTVGIANHADQSFNIGAKASTFPAFSLVIALFAIVNRQPIMFRQHANPAIFHCVTQ